MVVILGILWVPVIEKLAGGTMYSYLQNVQSYIAPPITAVFLLGIFSKRVNANGAIATLYSGLAIAAVRLSLEVFKDGFETNSLLYQIADMNFLKFSSFFFLYCVATTILVSIFSTTTLKKDLSGLTLSTLTNEQIESNRSSYTWVDITASLFVIVMVLYVMIYFS